MSATVNTLYLADQSGNTEGSIAPVIAAEHAKTCIIEAYKEACAAMRDAQDELYPVDGYGDGGVLSGPDQIRKKLSLERMRNILRVTKNIRAFLKGSELETEDVLNRYIAEIEEEARQLQW